MVTSLSWMVSVRTSFVTGRILAWNRNGLTSRSVGSGNKSGALFADVCARFVCSWYGDGGERLFLGFLVSSQRLVHMGGTGIASLLPCMYRAWGHRGVPPAGHLPWAEVGAISFVTSWGDCWAAQKTASCLDGSKNSFFNRKPHKLASAG